MSACFPDQRSISPGPAHPTEPPQTTKTLIARCAQREAMWRNGLVTDGSTEHVSRDGVRKQISVQAAARRNTDFRDLHRRGDSTAPKHCEGGSQSTAHRTCRRKHIGHTMYVGYDPHRPKHPHHRCLRKRTSGSSRATGAIGTIGPRRTRDERVVCRRAVPRGSRSSTRRDWISSAGGVPINSSLAKRQSSPTNAGLPPDSFPGETGQRTDSFVRLPHRTDLRNRWLPQ